MPCVWRRARPRYEIKLWHLGWRAATEAAEFAECVFWFLGASFRQERKSSNRGRNWVHPGSFPKLRTKEIGRGHVPEEAEVEVPGCTQFLPNRKSTRLNSSHRCI